MEEKEKWSLSILMDDSLFVKYNIADLPVYIQEEKLSRFRGEATPSHWNDDLETVYIREGQMDITVNGVTFRALAGQVVIINAGCVHFFSKVAGYDCVYVCGLANESIFSSCGPIQERYLQPLFHSFHPNYAIVKDGCPGYENLWQVFSSIWKILDDRPKGWDIKIVALFHEYLGVLYECLEEDFFLSSPVDSREARSFQKMLNYIYRNYPQKINVDDIAEEGDISRKTCYNLFHKYTGKTPAEIIMDYRLNVSRKKLTSSDLAIADIANECGFSHQSHFTNCFVKCFGITPYQYRKKYENKL